MKFAKASIYGTLVAIPFIGLQFIYLNPPQCPLDYTQEQVDASRCIVGANIGGLPIFVMVAIITWLIAIWLVNRLLSKRK